MTEVKDVFNKIKPFIPRDAKGLFLAITIAAFVFSFVFYLVFYPGTKKLFLFESLDNTDLYAESRFIPRNRTGSSLEYFCDELLLGPLSDRYRPLFARGTGMRAFLKKRGGTLYIDLNEKALFQSGISSEPKTGCRLLEQNIRKNYNSVDNIVITMMGREIYGYTD
ncbi:hypothetical protein V1L52_07875 [Treponema sp. HNW]|uniref:GerMN domain-containing protein n=1 Tax=Treponema sp. HNW TaxID=3116654 RepID=UPI003D0CB399